MPKSKIYLPDVNVWLALFSQRHVHNSRAVKWWNGSGQEPAAFCRITQMGLLRLLTNARVMGGDVIDQAQAWSLYEHVLLDPRVVFLGEPAGLEPAWKEHSQVSGAATNLWTDAYLLAFADVGDFLIVTLDRALSLRSQDRVQLLRD